jgi:hypothetical protein
VILPTRGAPWRLPTPGFRPRRSFPGADRGSFTVAPPNTDQGSQRCSPVITSYRDDNCHPNISPTGSTAATECYSHLQSYTSQLGPSVIPPYPRGWGFRLDVGCGLRAPPRTPHGRQLIEAANVSARAPPLQGRLSILSHTQSRRPSVSPGRRVTQHVRPSPPCHTQAGSRESLGRATFFHPVAASSQSSLMASLPACLRPEKTRCHI